MRCLGRGEFIRGNRMKSKKQSRRGPELSERLGLALSLNWSLLDEQLGKCPKGKGEDEKPNSKINSDSKPKGEIACWLEVEKRLAETGDCISKNKGDEGCQFGRH